MGGRGGTSGISKSVSGQTYDLRQEIKDRGFRWDGKNKKWVKKEG